LAPAPAPAAEVADATAASATNGSGGGSRKRKKGFFADDDDSDGEYSDDAGYADVVAASAKTATAVKPESKSKVWNSLDDVPLQQLPPQLRERRLAEVAAKAAAKAKAAKGKVSTARARPVAKKAKGQNATMGGKPSTFAAMMAKHR
jgi:hypothetical protein